MYIGHVTGIFILQWSCDSDCQRGVPMRVSCQELLPTGGVTQILRSLSWPQDSSIPVQSVRQTSTIDSE